MSIKLKYIMILFSLFFNGFSSAAEFKYDKKNEVKVINQERIKFEIYLTSVKPNSSVFINETEYKKTDEYGNATITGYYLPPGKYILSLKTKNNISNKDRFEFEVGSGPIIIKCSGIKEFECKSINNPD